MSGGPSRRRSGRDPWPVRFLGWLVAEPYRSDVLGDVLEEHGRESTKSGASSGRLVSALIRAGLASRWEHGIAMLRERRRLSHGSTRNHPRGAIMLDTTSQDLRAAWSSLRRNPGFTVAAVVILGVGTGAVLSIFTLISGVFLAPLPYESPERLVHVQGSADGRYAVSMPVHARAVAQASSIEASSAWQGWQAIVGDPERGIERRFGASVSADFFDVLGVQAAAGRLFQPEDGVPGHTRVVVLSHAFRQELFPGLQSAVGAELVLDGDAYTVVGVLPEDFLDPVAAHVLGSSQPLSFWRSDPPAFFDAADNPGWTAFWSVARLRPGVSPAHLRTEVSRTIAEAYPGWEDDGEWLRVRSFRDVASGHLRTTLTVLFAGAFLVLLIACANVANLLLSRATMRSRDMVVRASLGASRVRLIRQLFTENMLLAAAAALLGILFAALAMPVLTDLLQEHLRPGQLPRLNLEVAGFAVGLVIVTSLIFGLAPAIRTSEVRLGAVMRASRGPDQSGTRARGTLVAAEVALGVVVLVAAGLLGRTLWNLWSTDPGFDAASVVVTYISLPEEFITTHDEQNAAVAALERELSAIPGVSGVGLITDLPMSGAVNSTRIPRPLDAPDDPDHADQVLVRAVSPGYFDAMGVPLFRGRPIAATDAAGAAPVALVNRSYAELLPEGAVGRIVTVRGVPREIVGVVDDVVEFHLEDGTGDLVLYTPYPQEEQEWMRTGFYVALRTSAGAAALDAPVRAAVRSVSPSMLLSQLEPMSDYLSADLAAYRFRALLLALFATTALVLAAAGIAAVTAYSVARKVPEIGIRMALGASSNTVVSAILARSGRAVALGLAAGLAAAYATSRTLSHLLFGVRPADPAAYLMACAALSLVALLAAWIPARRAASIDPATALRSE